MKKLVLHNRQLLRHLRNLSDHLLGCLLKSYFFWKNDVQSAVEA